MNCISRIIILCVLVLLSSCRHFPADAELLQRARRFVCDYSQGSPQYYLQDPRRFIAHAGGGFKDRQYTNSKEALTASARNGFKLIELDLETTSDGHIVAAHDWEYWKKITGGQGEGKPTLKEFRTQKIHKDLSPLDSDTIREFFLSNSDLILVTDKVTDIPKLLATFPFHDRLIVETFSVEDYQSALRAGVVYPSLSIESSGGKDALSFAIEYKVPLVVLHSKNVSRWGGKLKQLVSAKSCVYAFSSNEENFLRDNFNNSIFGVYTDYWDLKNSKCSSNDCTTY